MQASDSPVAPPQSVEAEMELLGAILAYYSPRIVDEINGTGLAPSDFYRMSHAAVFGAIQQLHGDGEHVDAQTVARRLGPGLDGVGGQAGLGLLVAYSVPHGVRERAVMIREDAQWRRRLHGLYVAIEACHDRDAEKYATALAA